MPDERGESAQHEADNETGKLDLGVAPGGAHEHRHDLAGGIFLRGNHRLLDALLLFIGKKGLSIHFVTSLLKLLLRQNLRRLH
jgi:hypothetical protein